ncbi:hypothetical protein NDU88_004022 [Pleurodeles waltl]|uniref:Uncharacterized protein n=1 Tax=Pleurodeles waltl TaxID=8319 RepID=A0AAV7LIQ1_PLEWA|nr:hypothetical protein NDU88_004022 [Pleurodeles waltl]
MAAADHSDPPHTCSASGPPSRGSALSAAPTRAQAASALLQGAVRPPRTQPPHAAQPPLAASADRKHGLGRKAQLCRRSPRRAARLTLDRATELLLGPGQLSSDERVCSHRHLGHAPALCL